MRLYEDIQLEGSKNSSSVFSRYRKLPCHYRFVPFVFSPATSDKDTTTKSSFNLPITVQFIYYCDDIAALIKINRDEIRQLP